MARRRRLMQRAGWAALGLALLALVLSALYLAADAEGLGPGLAIWYPYVFVIAAAALLLLSAAILLRLRRLRRALREREPGARLNRRLLLLLLGLAIPPVLLVYGFSARFISATVDSWMRANSVEILGQALQVGRALLDERRSLAEREAAALAETLQASHPDDWQLAIERALDRLGAAQIALFSRDGRLLALAAAEPELVQASPPADELLLVLRASRRAVAAEQVGESLQMRALHLIGDDTQAATLQVISRLPASYAQGLLQVEMGIAEARQSAFLRDSLKLVFVLILSFVLLLSVLLAVLLAFVMSRRLVAPVGQLAAATERVSGGDYAARLPDSAADDELGFLLRGFNRMLTELDAASARARSSQAETERQRAYLDTVLQRLSSAVLVVDRGGEVRSANAATRGLLELAEAAAGRSLAALAADSPASAALAEMLGGRLAEDSQEFSVELAVDAAEGRRLWLVRGARLPDRTLLVVVDDTTAIDRARRDAAWGEVARRLAHEVKNPLTPIQLAAERLRHRVLPHLQGAEAGVLDRATHTIVAQVDALKTLVNAFSDYARTPALQRRELDLAALVDEVAELYAGDSQLRIELAAEPDLPRTVADAGRLRQVLHNLIKNAQEAGAGRVRLGVARQGEAALELSVEDDGPGLPEGFDTSWFEPYRSTKPKGTGLGLAIVRRIAEEHGGSLQAGRSEWLGGARFSLRLPRAAAAP